MVAEPVHVAVARLDTVCAATRPAWRRIVEAHEGVHEALVVAGESRRIAEAYARLSGEIRLFVVALRPLWTPATMAQHHRELLAALESSIGSRPDAKRLLERGIKESWFGEEEQAAKAMFATLK